MFIIIAVEEGRTGIAVIITVTIVVVGVNYIAIRVVIAVNTAIIAIKTIKETSQC